MHRVLPFGFVSLIGVLLASCGQSAASTTSPTAASSALVSTPTTASMVPTVVVANAPSAEPQAQKTTIIAYNTPPEWANWSTVLKDFAAASGVTVPPDNKNSGQALAQLVAEKDKPQADVAYFGVTFGIEAAKRQLLAPYKPMHWDDVPASLKDPEGRWVAIHSGSIAFIVNTKALGTTPVPQSWDDLLKPEYSGKIGFLDPSSAFAGYAVATAANLAKGGTLDNWEPGFTYFKALAKQQLIIPKQTATARVLSGEIPILIDYDFNGYRLKYKDNGPIAVVIPQEGTITLPYVIGLVNNGPNPTAGKQLLDYVLSDAGQRAWADGFVRPVRADMMSPETQAKFLPAADYARSKAVDYQQMATVQKTFTARWTSEIQP